MSDNVININDPGKSMESLIEFVEDNKSDYKSLFVISQNLDGSLTFNNTNMSTQDLAFIKVNFDAFVNEVFAGLHERE